KWWASALLRRTGTPRSPAWPPPHGFSTRGTGRSASNGWRSSFSRKYDEVDHRRGGKGVDVKKPYTKPAIVVSLKMESRAVQCSKANDTCGATGPITS